MQAPHYSTYVNLCRFASEQVTTCAKRVTANAQSMMKAIEPRIPEESRPAFRLLQMLWTTESLIQQRRLQEATGFLRIIESEWVNEANCLLPVRARLFLRLGLYGDAKEDLSLARKQGYNGLEDDRLLAWLQYQGGELDVCHEILQEAIKDYPESAEIWNMYGYVSLRRGSTEVALAAFDQAIDKKRDFADAWHNRGYAYATIGKLEKALPDLNFAISLYPNSISALVDRAGVHLLLGELDHARGDLDAAEQIDARAAAICGVPIYRSKLAMLEGDVEAAKAFAEEVRNLPSALGGVLIDIGFLEPLE